MGIPSKLYVARRAYGAEEVVGFMVVADKEHTKEFEKKKKSADSWAGAGNMPITISNEPRTGFQMVTNVSRYRTKNVLWRVRHPEGFEFEITSDNMCDLLATNTVINGVFQEELFFTESKQLVNTKTELFADMIKREEKVQNRKEAAKSLYEGAGFFVKAHWGTKKETPEQYVYCGKYHAMCVNKIKPLLQPTKSTLVHIVHNISTGQYCLRTSMDNLEFTTSEFLDKKIDRSTIVNEVNTYYTEWYNKNISVYDYAYEYKIPMLVSEKPFKMSDVEIVFKELPVQSIAARGVSENKIVEYIENDKIYRVFGSLEPSKGNSYYSRSDYHESKTLGSLIYMYEYKRKEDGHLDYSTTPFDNHQGFSGWRNKCAFENVCQKYHSHVSKPVLKVINTPETLRIGTYKLKGK